MTTTVTQRQHVDLQLVLHPGLAPVALPVSRYVAEAPITAVLVMDGLTLQTSDVTALRDLADAFHTAASELHAARMEWDEANQ